MGRPLKPKPGQHVLLIQDKLWDAIRVQAEELGMTLDVYITATMVAELDVRAAQAAKLARRRVLAAPLPPKPIKNQGWAAAQPAPRDVKDEDLPPLVQRSNTPSGFRGVYAQGQRWRAMHRGRLLGVFDTAPEAALARHEEKLLIKKAFDDEYDALREEGVFGTPEYGPVQQRLTPEEQEERRRAAHAERVEADRVAKEAKKAKDLEEYLAYRKEQDGVDVREPTAVVETPVEDPAPLGIFAQAPAPVETPPARKPAWEDLKERRRLAYRQELIENGMLDEHGEPFEDMKQFITEPY